MDARGWRGPQAQGPGECLNADNVPLMEELQKMDDECVRHMKQNLRYSVQRAMRSLQKYPLPITTHEEACALEGVGTFIAQRMLRGGRAAAAAAAAAAASAGGGAAAGAAAGKRKGKAPKRAASVDAASNDSASSSPQGRQALWAVGNAAGSGASSASAAIFSPSDTAAIGWGGGGSFDAAGTTGASSRGAKSTANSPLWWPLGDSLGDGGRQTESFDFSRPAALRRATTPPNRHGGGGGGAAAAAAAASAAAEDDDADFFDLSLDTPTPVRPTQRARRASPSGAQQDVSGVAAAGVAAGAMPQMRMMPLFGPGGGVGGGGGSGGGGSSASGGGGAAAATEPPPPKVAFEAGEWEALLLLDCREQDSHLVQAELLSRGVPCEVRQLPLGDMLWVARRRRGGGGSGGGGSGGAEERLVGYIVERKTAPDLASSICDGRYHEQKRRLRLSGIGRVIYLVEGRLTQQSSISAAALRTAVANTQVGSGFTMHCSANIVGSVAFLRRIHKNIAHALAAGSSSDACTSGGGYGNFAGSGSSGGSGSNGGGGGVWAGMTFREYQDSCGKNRDGSVRAIFGAGLVQLPNCSAGRASAILDKYPTPRALVTALAAAGSVTDRVQLLGELRCSKGKVLPKPLIRLLVEVYGPPESGSGGGNGGGGNGGGGSGGGAGCY